MHFLRQNSRNITQDRMHTLALILLGILSPCLAVSIKKEHSLVGPYTDSGEDLENWDLTGSAQLGGSIIRLTTDEEEKQGAIWNSFPSFANNWEFHVHFHVHGKGVHLNGDGMAIWYVREADMLQSGPVFGSKDHFSGLGVFIDTFGHHEGSHKHLHPYISAVVNNGSLHYEHDEDGTHFQVGACHAPLRNLEVPTRIAVSYLHNSLAVYLDNHGTGQWNLCFKSEGVYLPTGYYFGISASTSTVSDNHDVVGVTFLNFDQDDQPWVDNSDIIPEAKNIEILHKHHKLVEEEIQHIDKREVKDEEDETKETVSSSSLLSKLIYVTGAVLLIMVSISMYRKYSERRRERMEKRLF